MRRSTVAAIALLLLAGCAARQPARREVPPAPVTDTSNARAAFKQAYEALRVGEDGKALPVFEQLGESYPQLADYCLYLQAKAATRLGRQAEAESALTHLLHTYPRSVHVPAAQLALGRRRLEQGRIDDARSLLDAARDAPDGGTAREALLALADVDERSGDVHAAHADLMHVRREAVGTATGRAAKTRIGTLRARYPDLRPTGPTLLEEARLLLKERDFIAAEAAAAAFLATDGRDRTAALRVRADAQYGQGQIDAAVATLRLAADAAPTSDAAGDALYRLATILWNRDRDAAALDAFEELRRRYPQHARVPDALYAIGRIHQNAGRTAAAVASYEDLVRRDPSGPLGAEARWRIGWIYYQQQDWSRAAVAFARGGARDEDTYWRARSLEHAGQLVAAHAVYHDIIGRNPTGYYALWADQRLQRGTTAPLRVRSDDRAVPDPPDDGTSADTGTPDLPPTADGFHRSRADELRRIGLPDLARRELRAVERDDRNDPAVLQYLVQVYPTANGYADAMRVSRALGDASGLSPAQRKRILYPLAFWPAVRREARVESLDPFIVLGLMRQESLFDPSAHSPADARGLMQLLPSTAARVAAADDTRGDPEPDLTDPDVNIRLGSRYLRNLLDRYDGDALKSVAAYNGGEAAVDRWQRQFGDRDPDEFVERITYRETRDYVKKVVGNYRVYQQLYAAPGD